MNRPLFFRIQPKVFLVSSVLVLVFSFIHHTRPDLEYFPSDDALNTAIAVRNIHTCGYPRIAPDPRSSSWIEGFEYYLYYKYTAECFLRYPFYLFSTWFDYNWHTVSSLFYLFLLLGVVLLYGLRRSASDFPHTLLSFFFILLAASPWARTVFRISRYLPFTVLSVSLSFFFCLHLYKFGEMTAKRSLLLLWVAFLPTLFHILNLVFFLFWAMVFLATILHSLWHDRRMGRTSRFRLYATKTRVLLLLSALLTVGAALYLFAMYREGRWISLFRVSNTAIWNAFLENNIVNRTGNYCILALLIVGYFIFRTTAHGFVRKTALFTFLCCLFIPAVYSLVSGRRISLIAYKYLLHSHPIYLGLMAALLTVSYRALASRLPGRGVGYLLWVPLSLIFLSGLYSFNEKFDRKYRSNPFLELESAMRGEDPKELVIVCSRSVDVYYLLPEFKGRVYTFRNYSRVMDERGDSLTEWTRAGRYRYVKHQGQVIDMFAQVRIGTVEELSAMLTENRGKKILLYKIDQKYPFLSAELKEVADFLGRRRVQVIAAEELIRRLARMKATQTRKAPR